jgi:hypothetical protein
MKQWTFLLLAAALSVFFISCGNQNNPVNPAQDYVENPSELTGFCGDIIKFPATL